MEEDLACRLGLAQVYGDSPALCPFLLLVHHMGAASDANPLARCATSTSLQRVVGTLLEGTPCIHCSRSQCLTTSHAHESTCHRIPRRQRNTPGLQQAGHGEVVPHFFLPLHRATTWSSPDPAPESEGCPERVNAPPALGAGVKGLPVLCSDSLAVM